MYYIFIYVTIQGSSQYYRHWCGFIYQICVNHANETFFANDTHTTILTAKAWWVYKLDTSYFILCINCAHHLIVMTVKYNKPSTVQKLKMENAFHPYEIGIGILHDRNSTDLHSLKQLHKIAKLKQPNRHHGSNKDCEWT